MSETEKENGVSIERTDELLEDIPRMQDAIESLRQWKQEATEVLNAWHAVWVSADKPGLLGESMAQGVKDEVQWLRGQVGRLDRLEKIEAAARNLIKVKGRHHTEQAMKALIDAVNSQTF